MLIPTSVRLLQVNVKLALFVVRASENNPTMRLETEKQPRQHRGPPQLRIGRGRRPVEVALGLIQWRW